MNVRVIEGVVQGGEMVVRGTREFLRSEAGKTVVKTACRVALVWGLKTVGHLLLGPVGGKVAGTLVGLAVGTTQGGRETEVA